MSDTGSQRDKSLYLRKAPIMSREIPGYDRGLFFSP